MTPEEWVTAYVLQFGAKQAFVSGFVDGEHEFLDRMEASLQMEHHFDGMSHIQRTLRAQGFEP